MEFYRRLPGAISAADLQQQLCLEQLPRLCASIDTLLSASGDRGRIYCLWGEFEIERQTIRGGIRFSLPDCPNALCWSITTDLPPDPDELVIHCTINREGHAPDFIESIEQFIDDWQQGLEQALSRNGGR